MIDRFILPLEPNRRIEKSRLTRRIGVAAATTAMLLLISLCATSDDNSDKSRFAVVGTTDPETGIRIEYSVSSRYTKEIDKEYSTQNKNHDSFVDWKFTSQPARKTTGETHSNTPRSRYVAPVSDFGSEDPITQSSSKHCKMSGWYLDPQGFQSVDLKREKKMIVMAEVVSQERKMVGNCPTNVVVEDLDLVRPKGQGIIYIFETHGVEGMKPNPALQELKAIRDTIRVVKVK
jgi:hypothetical protein